MSTQRAFRLIEDDITEPTLHYALEESMLRRADENPEYPATLRLRRVSRTVLVGYAEQLEDTVDLDAARRLDVNIVRRHNLGGTVYQDLGSFMFTLLYRRGSLLAGVEEREVYREFCRLVCRFLERFGIHGELRGVNDVVVNERKIFGSSHTRIGDAESHTGTILVNMDLETLSQVLKFVPPKFSDKGFTTFHDALTTISSELQREVPISEAYTNFKEATAEYFNAKLRRDTLHASELEAAEALRKEKYGRQDFIYNRTPTYETLYTLKVKSGLLYVRGRFGTKIDHISISGDVLLSDRDLLVSISQKVSGTDYRTAQEIIRNSALSPDVSSALQALFEELSGSRT